MSSLLIQDLAVVLLVAGIVAAVCHRYNQPKLVGYILAGLLIGPYTPPFAFIGDEHTIHTLGELGIIFLMFSLGLDFNLRKIRTVGATAIVTAVLDVSVMVWLGYLLGRRLGWSPVESLFLGAIICDSSSTILSRILNELGLKHERFAQLALGTTIVEDILAVILIAALTGMALTGSVQADMVVIGLWQIILFMTVGVVGGLLIIPRILNYIHLFRSDELLVVTLVGLCFGVALLASVMGMSMALGAVLVGAIASESRALHRVNHLIAPLRHVFGAVFFVTIGLRLDPETIIQFGPEVLMVILLVVIGKFLTNSAGILLTGHKLENMVRVGAGMAQVGEFAFIISALAISLSVARAEIYQIGVVAATVTTLLNPYFIRGANRLVTRLRDKPSWQRWNQATGFYGQWMERVGQQSTRSAVRAIVHRSLWVVCLNVVLICGVFGVAGYLLGAANQFDHVPFVQGRFYGPLLWLAATIASLPLYVVTARKVEALAMILAEAAFPSSERGEWVRSIRLFLGRAIMIASSAGLVLVTFILSSTLLPSVESFVVLGLITIVFAIWARSSLSLFYARARDSLQSMLSQPVQSGLPAKSTGAEDMRHMKIVAIPVSKSKLHGHSLRSLNLRTRSGATVVAVERHGKRITNPDPDFPLEMNDQLLLLGSHKEVEIARSLL